MVGLALYDPLTLTLLARVKAIMSKMLNIRDNDQGQSVVAPVKIRQIIADVMKDKDCTESLRSKLIQQIPGLTDLELASPTADQEAQARPSFSLTASASKRFMQQCEKVQGNKSVSPPPPILRTYSFNALGFVIVIVEVDY
jgi:hypothetical protein